MGMLFFLRGVGSVVIIVVVAAAVAVVLELYCNIYACFSLKTKKLKSNSFITSFSHHQSFVQASSDLFVCFTSPTTKAIDSAQNRADAISDNATRKRCFASHLESIGFLSERLWALFACDHFH